MKSHCCLLACTCCLTFTSASKTRWILVASWFWCTIPLNGVHQCFLSVPPHLGNTVSAEIFGLDPEWLCEAEIHHPLQDHHVYKKFLGWTGIPRGDGEFLPDMSCFAVPASCSSFPSLPHRHILCQYASCSMKSPLSCHCLGSTLLI